MRRALTLYDRMPIALQHAIATGYGARQRMLRCGGRYSAFVKELKESEWWPRERLEHSQDTHLRRLIAYCYREVPYYTHLFDSMKVRPEDIRSTRDLSVLPLLEKETVRSRAGEFLPRRPSERLIAQTTGGTTGKPLQFYVTPTAVQYNAAHHETRGRQWAGVKLGQRMASINGQPVVPIGQSQPPFWRYNLAFHQLYLSAYHLNDRNAPHYLARLEKFKPEFIVGYVSTVHSLARAILARGLPERVCPKAVLVSSETLFDSTRADIEKAFGCRVFNGYGLGEMTAFISECDRGSLHVSPEYGVVETVPGPEGLEIVSTGLFNYGMPLLRYRTGDLVETADQRVCSCGRELPTVKALTGRMDDRIVTPEGVSVGPAALSLVFQSVPHLKGAQLYQPSRGELWVYISVAARFDSSSEQILLSELRRRLGATIVISVIRVEDLARTIGGKQLLVLRRPAGTINNANRSSH